MKTTLSQKIARVLLGSAMILAGIAHLTFKRREFRAQVPRWLTSNPGRMGLVVLASGVVEIALGLTPIFAVKNRVRMGIALAIFYVLVFPGNISQYTHHINGLSLNTDTKRFTRLFFQPVLIFWALWSTGALRYLKSKKHALPRG